MTDLPYLTENLLLQMSPDQSFAHGMRIYNAGALYELERRENTFRGYCQAAGHDPQAISVVLGPEGIRSTACTCEHRGEGLCAHAVALLLVWIYQPEAFAEVTARPLAERLAHLSKAELIEMIEEMLRYVPDLERVMGLTEEAAEAPASEGALPESAPATFDLTPFQRKIDFIIEMGYPETHAVVSELQTITDAAERFAREGVWVNAGKLHHLLLEGILPYYETLFDEGGQIAQLLLISAERLGECLAMGQPDAPTHQAWIAVLLATEFKAIKLGGIEPPTPAGRAVIARATEDEWGWVEQQVREAITRHESDLTWWGREALLDLLVRRHREAGREAAAQAQLLELGSPQQRAFALLRRGKIDAAIETARQFANLPDQAIQFADTLVDAGMGDRAEAFVASLGDTIGRTAYIKWLGCYAEAAGNLEAAADRYEQNFWEVPTLRTYQTLCRVGRRAQGWGERRASLLQALEERQRWALLLQVLLYEGDIERALDAIQHLDAREYTHYAQEVARAAENEHPMEALRIYWEYVTAFVNAGGRDQYHQAVDYLLRIRALCRRFDRLDVWDAYIDDLRTRHSHVTALQDELDKAGL